jgi:hypothetical protein
MQTTTTPATDYPTDEQVEAFYSDAAAQTYTVFGLVDDDGDLLIAATVAGEHLPAHPEPAHDRWFTTVRAVDPDDAERLAAAEYVAAVEQMVAEQAQYYR